VYGASVISALLVVLLALSPMAPAGIETDPEMKKAQALVDAFEYEKAAAAFEGLAQRQNLTDPDRAVVLVWLGLTYTELREQAKASVAFEDAVTADPLIVLPRDASPKIKTLLEDARARVRLRPRPKPPDTTTNNTATNNGGAANNGATSGNPSGNTAGGGQGGQTGGLRRRQRRGRSAPSRS
jgi:hypothetical protein